MSKRLAASLMDADRQHQKYLEQTYSNTTNKLPNPVIGVHTRAHLKDLMGMVMAMKGEVSALRHTGMDEKLKNLDQRVEALATSVKATHNERVKDASPHNPLGDHTHLANLVKTLNGLQYQVNIIRGQSKQDVATMQRRLEGMLKDGEFREREHLRRLFHVVDSLSRQLAEIRQKLIGKGNRGEIKAMVDGLNVKMEECKQMAKKVGKFDAAMTDVEKALAGVIQEAMETKKGQAQNVGRLGSLERNLAIVRRELGRFSEENRQPKAVATQEEDRQISQRLADHERELQDMANRLKAMSQAVERGTVPQDQIKGMAEAVKLAQRRIDELHDGQKGIEDSIRRAGQVKESLQNILNKVTNNISCH